MLKKQHILLGILFLGISIKPMDNDVYPAIKAHAPIVIGTVFVVISIKALYKYIFSVCVQKNLYYDREGFSLSLYPTCFTNFTKENFKSINTVREGQDVAIYNKRKSLIPFFSIIGHSIDTNEDIAQCAKVELFKKINDQVHIKHVPSLFSIFMGQRNHNRFDNKVINGLIEQYNKKSCSFICGWILKHELSEGLTKCLIARMINEKDNNGSKFFQAWLGDMQNNNFCCKLFQNRSIGKVKITCTKFDKCLLPFLVIAKGELDSGKRINSYEKSIVNNVSKIINLETILRDPYRSIAETNIIHEFSTEYRNVNCNIVFAGIPIKKNCDCAVTVVKCYDKSTQDLYQ